MGQVLQAADRKGSVVLSVDVHDPEDSFSIPFTETDVVIASPEKIVHDRAVAGPVMALSIISCQRFHMLRTEILKFQIHNRPFMTAAAPGVRPVRPAAPYIPGAGSPSPASAYSGRGGDPVLPVISAFILSHFSV